MVSQRVPFTQWRIIKVYSEQLGAAHESENVDESLARALCLNVGGFNSPSLFLYQTSQFAYQLGRQVLDYAAVHEGHTLKARPTAAQLGGVTSPGPQAAAPGATTSPQDDPSSQTQ
jgi:hypothetical protein